MIRRRLFYLGGFDPRGARFYHSLLRDEIARLAALNGDEIATSPRRKGTGMSVEWTVANATAGLETDVGYLRWDDFVGRAWIKGLPRLTLATLAAYWRYARRHDWRAYRRLGPGPFVTTLYPLLLALLLPLVLAAPVALPLVWLLPAWLATWLAVPLGLAAGIALARPLLERIRAGWLIRLFVFNDFIAVNGFPPELTQRLAGFADQIAEALDDGNYDEVLLVAHSNGSILAVPLLLALAGRLGPRLPERFAFVTLGHCIPLLTCRRDAGFFHAMLRELSALEFAWTDIGAPPDGAAFSLVDPLAPAASHGAIRLTLLSPRFHRFFPASYNKGLANKYELHFDYLRTGERLSPLSLPSLIALPATLPEALAAFTELS